MPTNIALDKQRVGIDALDVEEALLSSSGSTGHVWDTPIPIRQLYRQSEAHPAKELWVDETYHSNITKHLRTDVFNCCTSTSGEMSVIYKCQEGCRQKSISELSTPLCRPRHSSPASTALRKRHICENKTIRLPLSTAACE
jgi:hypothetical protein